MNNAAVSVADAMLQPVITPSSTIKLRKRFPRWSVTNSYINIPGGDRYIEQPDRVKDADDGNTIKCFLDAPGTFQSAFSGWNVAIPGDSDFSDSMIVRIYAPAAIGDEKWGDNIYVYKTTNGSSWGGNDLSTPWHTITPVDTDVDYAIKVNSRPGVFVDGESIYVYFHTVKDKIMCVSYLNGSWGAPYAVTSVMDVAGWPVAVAPVAVDEIVTYYYDGRTKAYRIGHWIGGVKNVENMLATFHREEERTGFEFHAFDAEKIYSDQIMVVANNSKFGNSRSYYIYGGHVSDPQIILPLDDVDWTGTLIVYSLSKVETYSGPRLYAIATQRFAQGDGTYSAPLTTALWANSTSDTHWTQARYLPVSTNIIYGKICLRDDGVFIVSPTQVMRGDRTVDFGGNGSNVEVDISNSVLSWSMSMVSGNATSIKHKVDPKGHSIFDTSDWLNMADEIVTTVGTIETSGGFTVKKEALLMIGEVVDADNSMTVVTGTIPFTSRGPIGKMVAGVQFTDEILTRAIDERFEMDENTMINAGGSTWYAKDGWLISAYPNKNDESFAFNSSPIRSSFFIKAALQYDKNSSSVGIIFWADTKNYEAGGEYPAHNHYLFRLDEAESPFAGYSTEKWPRLYRRTGTRDKDGEWTDSLELLAEGDKIALSMDKAHYFIVQFTGGKVRVLANWEDDAILEWAPNKVTPKEYLCGIYAKTRRAKSTSSKMSGETIIEVDDIADWAVSGDVTIDKKSYGYTKKDDKTMELDRGLDAFMVDGSIITPSDNRVRFNWFQVNSSDNRYSVADVFKHIAARSGVYAHVDRAFYLLDMDLVYGSFTHVDEYYRIGSSDTLFLSDELLTNASFKVTYDNFVSGSELHLRLQLGADEAGFGINIEKGTGNNDWAHLMHYDGTVTDLSDGHHVFKNPITKMPEKGQVKCVVQEGFVHLYINDTFLTSLYGKNLTNLSWNVGVGGRSVDIVDVITLVGADVMLPGIWDSTTEAKRIIGDMLKGRPLTFVDREDGTIRLMKTYKHDNLGEVELDHVFEVSYGKIWEQPGSALLLQGGYDWTVSFDDDMLTDTGLVWENRENHTLMSPEAMRHYARIALAENKAKSRGYSWTARLDPRMIPNDKFYSKGHKSMPDGNYVIGKIQHKYVAPKEERAPTATSSGAARKLEEL